MVLGETSLGRPDFGRSAPYPAPPLPHALHDDNVDGVVAKGVDDGLPIEHGVQPKPQPEVEPEPALPLGCRWRVPLTWVLDRPKTRCVKCTSMCASARVAPSNIVYSWYGYRSIGIGVLTTKVLLFR